MKKVLIIGAGAMGAAFSFPLVDNNHKVTLTEPYNFKLISQLFKKKKFHPSLKMGFNCSSSKFSWNRISKKIFKKLR